MTPMIFWVFPLHLIERDPHAEHRCPTPSLPAWSAAMVSGVLCEQGRSIDALVFINEAAGVF